LESDDRIAAVLSGIDEALLELDSMDTNITAYKMQLSVSLLEGSPLFAM
jgi:hypothetical protein